MNKAIASVVSLLFASLIFACALSATVNAQTDYLYSNGELNPHGSSGIQTDPYGSRHSTPMPYDPPSTSPYYGGDTGSGQAYRPSPDRGGFDPSYGSSQGNTFQVYPSPGERPRLCTRDRSGTVF